MYVTKEEFGELVKKVETFRKITSACHGTVTKIREQLKDHEGKVEQLEHIVKEIKLKELEISIERIKEEQKVNSEGIIEIDQKLLTLEEDQKSIKDSIKTNDLDTKKQEGDIKEINEKLVFLSPMIVSTKTTYDQSQSNYKCKLCNSVFGDERSLKSHMKAQHIKPISCNQCDKIFEINSDLEDHLCCEHGETKTHMCHLCDMSFIFEWRLQKHIKGHSETRTCHYFNNNEECPFTKVGCKFLHKTAVKCKYAEYCTRTKCQFRHK